MIRLGGSLRRRAKTFAASELPKYRRPIVIGSQHVV